MPPRDAWTPSTEGRSVPARTADPAATADQPAHRPDGRQEPFPGDRSGDTSAPAPAPAPSTALHPADPSRWSLLALGSFVLALATAGSALALALVGVPTGAGLPPTVVALLGLVLALAAARWLGRTGRADAQRELPARAALHDPSEPYRPRPAPRADTTAGAVAGDQADLQTLPAPAGSAQSTAVSTLPAGPATVASPAVARAAETATPAHASREAEAEAGTPDPLAAAERERQSFVYAVSHDLRAPLRVIEGFARIVKEDYGSSLDRIGNDHVDRILGAAGRMGHMIDALLALSRLGTQPLQQVEVDLSALAAQVIDELQRQAPQRRVEVAIEPGLVATGDPTLLRIVLDNLLGNAWKYTARRNPAHLAFGRAAADVTRPAGVTAGARVFCIADDGAGFDMRFADRLFMPFQRLHSASEFAGTGVGLASVRRIVHRHGGEIWAEAEIDRGARFCFSLG